MKKMVKSALALMTAFLATACMQENFNPEKDGSTVTFTVAVPEAVATKAAEVKENGENINNLVYAVYRTEKDNQAEAIANLNPELFVYGVNPVAEGKPTVFADNKTTISLELINNQKYVVLFWAQVDQTWVEGAIGESSLTTISYPERLFANDSKYAAFSGVAFVEEVKGSRKESVTLTRPFAQINLATNNPERYDVDVIASSVTIENAAETFNVATQQASGTTTVEYESATNPDGTFNVATNPDGTFNVYDHYVAMNYIFANPKRENSQTVSVTCVIDTKEHGEGIEKVITNVPVAQNYKTNIVGNLLTSDVEYTVTLEKGWGGADLAPDELYLAAAIGGEVTLSEDVALTSPLVVNSKMTINLNGKTISGDFHKSVGAIIKNYGILTITGGTISSTGDNGGSAVMNNGTMIIENVTLNGAPNANGSWPGYTVNNTGELTINNSKITSHHGAVASYGEGAIVTLNDSEIDMAGIPSFTSHGIYTYDNGKVVVNGGIYVNKATDQNASGASVINGTVEVNAGKFTGRIEAYYGTPVLKGGSYTVKPNDNFIAAGYKAISIDGKFYVLPEVVADAATAATVTAVTESTADVATALATDNGEATMFMWNDVAYIAKYGEVIITSSADEATTVRGVVESAAGLTSATVAEGIEVVGNRTFRKCANLETVVFPNTLTEIGPAVFQSCPKLANVNIPASVTTIGEGAFAECTCLTSINIPEGITRLEKDVLRNTGLTSIEIPASVNYIGTYAFRDCESLTEVTILSPEFTIENNSFTNMAAPVPTMTIKVVNVEMEAYLNSILTTYDKTYITVVGPTKVSDTEDLNTALADGKDVFLTADIAVANTEVGSNGYGATGISQLKGGTIDGNGKSISVNAWGTWDSAINTTGGTIKNVNVTGGMRGIFINHNSDYSEKVILQNVTIDGTIYTISCDQGTNKGLEAYNSTFNGWTSYAATIGTVKFDHCSFGEGQGYAFCRPYAATEFVNCAFETGFELDAVAAVTFENCTLGGVALTAENLSTLVIENATNATVK